MQAKLLLSQFLQGCWPEHLIFCLRHREQLKTGVNINFVLIATLRWRTHWMISSSLFGVGSLSAFPHGMMMIKEDKLILGTKEYCSNLFRLSLSVPSLIGIPCLKVIVNSGHERGIVASMLGTLTRQGNSFYVHQVFSHDNMVGSPGKLSYRKIIITKF